MRVTVREAIAGRDALVAQAGFLELERLGRRAELQVRGAVEPLADVLQILLDVGERERQCVSELLLRVRFRRVYARLSFQRVLSRANVAERRPCVRCSPRNLSGAEMLSRSPTMLRGSLELDCRRVIEESGFF